MFVITDLGVGGCVGVWGGGGEGVVGGGGVGAVPF